LARSGRLREKQAFKFGAEGILEEKPIPAEATRLETMHAFEEGEKVSGILWKCALA
jgi:hypothetical protein